MMHALVLICINQYTKFEMTSFTNYKDLIGAKFKLEAQLPQRDRAHSVMHALVNFISYPESIHSCFHRYEKCTIYSAFDR